MQCALHTDGFLLIEAVTGAAAERVSSREVSSPSNSQCVSRIRQFRAALNKAGKRAAVMVQFEGNMIFIQLKFQNE